MVTTDVSDAAVGAILEQDFGNGLQPVAFASQKLNNAEMRYRGGQTFPKSTEIRNSVAFRAVFSVFFRPNFSVWQNRFPSSFCSSHDVLTYWEANSG